MFGDAVRISFNFAADEARAKTTAYKMVESGMTNVRVSMDSLTEDVHGYFNISGDVKKFDEKSLVASLTSGYGAVPNYSIYMMKRVFGIYLPASWFLPRA